MKFKSQFGEIYELDIDENDSIIVGKEKLSKIIYAKTNNIRFVFQCNILDDCCSFHHYNISISDVISFSVINEKTLHNGTSTFCDTEMCECKDFKGPRCKLKTIFVNIANFKQKIIYKIRTFVGKKFSAALKESPFKKLWNKSCKLIYNNKFINQNCCFLHYQITKNDLIIQIDGDEDMDRIPENIAYGFHESSWKIYGLNYEGECEEIWITFHNKKYQHFTTLENIKLISVSNLIQNISSMFDIPCVHIRIFQDINQNDQIENDPQLQEIVSKRRSKKFYKNDSPDLIKDDKVKYVYQYSIQIYYAFVPTLEEFIQINIIGRGSFGTVYKCVDINSNKVFALKKFNLTDHEWSLADDLRNEIDILCAIGHHPRIVNFVKKIFTDSLYILMEYMSEGSLQMYLNKNGPLKEDLISKFTRQILEALDYLHKLKIIHRDIKGDNVLLDDDCNVKLSDFGLSKCMVGIKTTVFQQKAAKSLVGTCNFMAPEVINGNNYGCQADVWSVGATIIEMLTGKPPYHNLEMMQVLFKVGNEGKLDFDYSKGLSDDLSHFLDLCLKRDPLDRATVSQLLNDPFIELSRILKSCL